jgi:hypothetical protein
MRILVRSWKYSYPAATAGVRAAIGILLILIGITLCATGFWWGALLMVIGALTMMVAGNGQLPKAACVNVALRGGRCHDPCGKSRNRRHLPRRS